MLLYIFRLMSRVLFFGISLLVPLCTWLLLRFLKRVKGDESRYDLEPEILVDGRGTVVCGLLPSHISVNEGNLELIQDCLCKCARNYHGVRAKMLAKSQLCFVFEHAHEALIFVQEADCELTKIEGLTLGATKLPNSVRLEQDIRLVNISWGVHTADIQCNVCLAEWYCEYDGSAISASRHLCQYAIPNEVLITLDVLKECYSLPEKKSIVQAIEDYNLSYRGVQEIGLDDYGALEDIFDIFCMYPNSSTKDYVFPSVENMNIPPTPPHRVTTIPYKIRRGIKSVTKANPNHHRPAHFISNHVRKSISDLMLSTTRNRIALRSNTMVQLLASPDLAKERSKRIKSFRVHCEYSI
ncbi:hypothetical protein PCE1_003828 [Barthelona sp. PCE]